MIVSKKTPLNSRSAGASRDLRNRAEALLTRSEKEIALIPGADIKALVYELQVHQVELEIQNEELLKAEAKLSESRDHYSDLYDFAPVGYLTFDPDTTILDANLTAAEMLGVNRAQLIGSKFSDFVDREAQDMLFLFRRKLFASNEVQNCELLIRSGAGTERSIRLQCAAAESTDSGKASCRVALIDITGEKEAEEWKRIADRTLEMVEHLPTGAVHVDRGEILLNRVAEQITGYSRTELTKLDDWFRLLHGSLNGEQRKQYQSHFDAGFPDLSVYRIRHKDGTERVVEFSAHRFDDHSVWILNDITEREAAEKSLRIQEERNRSILSAAVDAIITIDQEGLISSVNPAAEKIFGYSAGELLGENVSILVASPDREQYDRYLADHQKTGKADFKGIAREVTGRHKDGSTFPADLAIGEADKMGFYTGIVRDISRRKLVEERARQEREFSESLIEAAQSIILVLDCDGRIIRYNAVLERITGRSLQDVEGCDWFETFLPVEDQSRIRERCLGVSAVTPLGSKINPIITESGGSRDIEWQSAPLREPDGTVIGLVCCGIDITDRLHLEQEVFRASEEEKISIAQDLHDGLGSLLIGISYLFGAVAKDLRLGTAVEDKAIERVTDNLADAIEQASALAHGLHGISDEPNALPGALKRLIAWARSSSDLECRFTASSDTIVITDAAIGNHVFRIAQEAVNNAIRHSGAKLLTLRIATTADGSFTLTVLDNGSGFDPVKLSDRGIGLRTMDYRARAIGAMFSIQRREKGGTRVECIFSDR